MTGEERSDDLFRYRVSPEDEAAFIDHFAASWTEDQFDLVTSGFKTTAGEASPAPTQSEIERIDPVADPVAARDVLLNPSSVLRVNPRPFVLPLEDYLAAAGTMLSPDLAVLCAQHDLYLLQFAVGARPAPRERFTEVRLRFDHPASEAVMTYRMSPQTQSGGEAGTAGQAGTAVDPVTAVEMDVAHWLRADADSLAPSARGTDAVAEIHRWRLTYLPAEIVALGQNTSYADWTISQPRNFVGDVPFVTVVCVPKGCRTLTVAASGRYQIKRNLRWWSRPTTVLVEADAPIRIDLPARTAEPTPAAPITTAPITMASSPAGAARDSARGARSANPTAVVLTMVPSEFLAAREHLGADWWERVEHGTIYDVGTFLGRHATWTVAITEIGPGNVTAAAEVERAVRVFGPELVLLVGVAGGRKDVALGDVVAADAVYDYETGKATSDGFVPRIKTQNPSYGLVQRARRVAADGAWRTRIIPACPTPPPNAFVKPIAAGSQVIADRRSAAARRLDQYCADALAVDMEGHGFLHGAYLNRGVDALVVRGISDLLSGKDEDNDARWQPVAARNAAAFAFEVLGTHQPTGLR